MNVAELHDAEDGGCLSNTMETDIFLHVKPDGRNKETNKDNEANQDHNLTDFSLYKRLKMDLPYRQRFVHTMWLFWAFIGLGWMVGQVSSSFPDLRIIVQEDLDTASWIFTVGSFGFLMGSLFGGVLYDHFNKLLLIFFSALIVATATAVIPWCTSLPLMLALKFVRGLGSGCLNTGGNADLVSLWDEEGRPYMQALHFWFGFGGVISPLVTEPFLAKKSCLSYPQNTTDSYATSIIYLTSTTEQKLIASASPPCREVYGETRVQYAYLISFFIILSGAVPFLVMYINSARNKSLRKDMQADKSNNNRPQRLPLSLKVVSLLLLASVIIMYSTAEGTFSRFLMTFCLRHLDWSKQLGSYATSLYWAALTFGRFSSIFLIKRFSPVQLLFGCGALLVFSLVCFTIASVTMVTSLVWVFVPIVGFSMSAVFPCIVTWTEENILEVTGKISSMLTISSSIGPLLSPLLIGYLMDKYAPIIYTYFLLAESFMLLVILLITLLLVNRYIKPIVKKELTNANEICAPNSTTNV